jgi:2-dehydropantoate 2-reductase
MRANVTIIGTGAMACLFGARLAAVARVTLTGAWTEGIAALRAGGIRVGDPGVRSPAPVAAIPWDADIEPADLALILVKAWQTEKVASRLSRLLKPEGIALTLQNGLGNIELLGDRTCLGVTYLGATLIGPGHVLPGGSGTTWIAAPDWVVRLFRKAGLAAEQGDKEQLDSLLWGKLVVNCGINALTALLRIRNGELLDRPDALSLMDRAALECAAIANAKGISLPFPDPAEKVREVARSTAINQSSMLQDVLRGAPTECDAINGAVVCWGNRLGVPTPVNEVLHRLVRASVKYAQPWRTEATADKGGCTQM